MTELWRAACLGDVTACLYRAGGLLGLSLNEGSMADGRGMTGYVPDDKARALCLALLANGYGPDPNCPHCSGRGLTWPRLAPCECIQRDRAPSSGRISREEWVKLPFGARWSGEDGWHVGRLPQPHPWPWSVAHGSHVPVPYHWLGADAETEDR